MTTSGSDSQNFEEERPATASDMNETAVTKYHGSRPEMVSTENATREEKSSGRTLAFSIDKIMSNEMKPGSSAIARSTNRRIWKTGDMVTRGEGDDATTPEAEVIANRQHRNKPEVVSRNDAVTRYHLQQQKMKIANAVMLQMATGNGMAPEVGGLFSAARHPELLYRQYQRHPYHLQSNVHAERYHQNAPLSVDPVTSSFNRCRLPVSSDVARSPSNRRADYHSQDKPEFTSELLLSPVRPNLWRKRSFYDQRDATDWSQMATGSLLRHRPSPARSPQSVISSCSAAPDEEEIVVDDDVDDRKQFSPASELPVERQEAVNDSGDSSWTGKSGDVDLERSPGERRNSTTWCVLHVFE